MSYIHDSRIVLTLDAGGTNFVFSAMRAGEEITGQVNLPSYAEDLDKCLSIFVQGFSEVLSQLEALPVAISFAFPGPADYPHGIIGGELPNMKAFRGGVALGPFLEEKFGLPVFINNDGDLFAYGEAMGGILPEVNKRLEQRGSNKRYQNLLGITLGTGFGAGVVIKNELLTGDNACSGEIYANRNSKYPEYIVEESVSIRAVQRVYAELSGDYNINYSPKDIYEIAEGIQQGNADAAKKAFIEMGTIAGEAIANIITILDGLIVIGGGLSGAKKYFLPALVQQMNSTIGMMDGTVMSRIPLKVFNLEEEKEMEEFLEGSVIKVQVYGTSKLVEYDPAKRTGVAISQSGASKAIMLGAYAFALNEMDKLETGVINQII
jgi:glucokinase